MKYEAWLTTNFQYKYRLINNLSDVQYNNFRKLLCLNLKQAEYILYKRLNLLFNFDNYSNLSTYSNKQLIKLYKISNHIGLENAVYVFNHASYDKISVNNVDKLSLYLKDKEQFEKKLIKVNWGPGNNKDIQLNINNHYTKHVLSLDENEYWNFLNVKDANTYKQFAIDAFYKMTNVIVHTDGRNMYLSGIYKHIFIIGRYDKDVFGISSCYYVNNGEKEGRYAGLCFNLSF